MRPTRGWTSKHKFHQKLFSDIALDLRTLYVQRSIEKNTGKYLFSLFVLGDKPVKVSMCACKL